MFYAHIILAKKGPLARVWLAAHWDKKITKAHVFETNIEKSVEGIMQPKVKLALRTSGHLLLGVVRIYSRKAKYLLADCNEAFVKIKMAFRPGMVDLPEGHREANVNAITLPEVFHDFDTALPELNDIDIEAQFSINQSRADEITMREDYGTLSLSMHDDGFGDMGFEGDTPDLMRGHLDDNIDNELFGHEDVMGEVNSANLELNEADMSKACLNGDGFGDEFGQPQLFEDDLFGEPPLETTITEKVQTDGILATNSKAESDKFPDRPPSTASSGHHSPGFADDVDDHHLHDDGHSDADHQDVEALASAEHTTLIQNEDESFALAPVDASAYKGVTKTKRKRKLIVDEIKNISGEEMKAQLANTSDIVTTLDLAPPTKRLMYWKETGGVEKLFALPSRTIPARALLLNYNRHLNSRFSPLEDFSCLGPSDLLALDQVQNENESPNIISGKRGRKRKQTAVQESALAVTLAAPEPMREADDQGQVAAVSQLSIGGIASTELEQTGSSTAPHLFGAGMRSPATMFSMHDINGIDTSDDFHHEELHHGHMTPHHASLENIESIPNLPADQVSSILNEAESVTGTGVTGMQIASDWNDFDLPPMIGIQTSEEQMENETTEQFEERVLNKRAAQLFYAVRNHLMKEEFLYLSELTVRNTRKQAAQKFYSLLVLKKFRTLNITQASPYSDIMVSRGSLFENPKL